MQTIEQVIRIFAFVAVALLVLGIVRNATGTATVLNSFGGLLSRGYNAEIAGAGTKVQR